MHSSGLRKFPAANFNPECSFSFFEVACMIELPRFNWCYSEGLEAQYGT